MRIRTRAMAAAAVAALSGCMVVPSYPGPYDYGYGYQGYPVYSGPVFVPNVVIGGWWHEGGGHGGWHGGGRGWRR